MLLQSSEQPLFPKEELLLPQHPNNKRMMSKELHPHPQPLSAHPPLQLVAAKSLIIVTSKMFYLLYNLSYEAGLD